jgi:hypothetical protein
MGWMTKEFRFDPQQGRKNFLHRVQKGSGAQPVCYSISIGGLLPRSKAIGAWSWPLHLPKIRMHGAVSPLLLIPSWHHTCVNTETFVNFDVNVWTTTAPSGGMKTKNSLSYMSRVRDTVLIFDQSNTNSWWITVSCGTKEIVCRRWLSLLLQWLIRFRHWAFWAWYENCGYIRLTVLEGPHFLACIKTSLWMFYREIIPLIGEL